jgi:hypothetical protein
LLNGLNCTLEEICQIKQGSRLADEIAAAWRSWDL